MSKSKPMQGQTFDYLPGYLSPTEVAQRLGVSKQAFYKSGLAQVLDRYQQGKGAATYYKEEDVEALACWLFVREGLIRLGLRRGNSPKAPTDAEYQAALAGRWDVTCPSSPKPPMRTCWQRGTLRKWRVPTRLRWNCTLTSYPSISRFGRTTDRPGRPGCGWGGYGRAKATGKRRFKRTVAYPAAHRNTTRPWAAPPGVGRNS
jgi:hypothetical protein